MDVLPENPYRCIMSEVDDGADDVGKEVEETVDKTADELKKLNRIEELTADGPIIGKTECDNYLDHERGAERLRCPSTSDLVPTADNDATSPLRVSPVDQKSPVCANGTAAQELGESSNKDNESRALVNGHDAVPHLMLNVEQEPTSPSKPASEPAATIITTTTDTVASASHFSPDCSVDCKQSPVLPNVGDQQSDNKDSSTEISVSLTGASDDPSAANECNVDNLLNGDQTCDDSKVEVSISSSGQNLHNDEVSLANKDAKKTEESCTTAPSADLLLKLKAFVKVTNLAGTAQFDWPAEMVLTTKAADCLPLTYSHNPLQFDYAKLYSGVSRKRKNADSRNNDSGGGKTGHKGKKKKKKAKLDNIPLGSVRVKETSISTGKQSLTCDSALTGTPATSAVKQKNKKQQPKRTKVKKAPSTEKKVEEAGAVEGVSTIKSASSTKVIQQKQKKSSSLSATGVVGVDKLTGRKRHAEGDTANGLVKDTAVSKWETSSESENENAATQQQAKGSSSRQSASGSTKRRRVDSHSSDKAHQSAHSSVRGRSVSRSRSRSRSSKRSYSSGSSRSSRHSSSRSRSRSHRRRRSVSSRRRSSSYDDSSASSRSRSSRSRRDSRSSSAYSRSSRRRSSSRSRSRSSSSRHRRSRSRSRLVKRSGGLSKRSSSEESVRRSSSRPKSAETNAKNGETTEDSAKLPKKAAAKSGSGVDLSAIPTPKEQDVKKISLPAAPEPKGKGGPAGSFIGPTLPTSHHLFHLDIPMPHQKGQAGNGGAAGARDVFQRIGPNDPLVFKAASESTQPPAAPSFEIPPDQLDQYRLLQKKAAKHAMQQMRREQGLPVEDDDDEEEEAEAVVAADAEGVMNENGVDNLDMIALEQQQAAEGLTEEQLEQLLLQQQQQQQLQQMLIAASPQTQLLAGGQAIQLLGGGGAMPLQALTPAAPAAMQLVQMPNGQLVFAAAAAPQSMAAAGGVAMATAGGGQVIFASPQHALQLQQLQAQQALQLQAQQQALQLQAAAAAQPQLFAAGGLGGMTMLAGGGLATLGGLSGLTAVRLASGGMGLAATRPTLMQASHPTLQALHPGLQAYGLAQQPQLVSRELLAAGGLRLPGGLQIATQAAGYPVMLGGPRYVLQRLPQGP